MKTLASSSSLYGCSLPIFGTSQSGKLNLWQKTINILAKGAQAWYTRRWDFFTKSKPVYGVMVWVHNNSKNILVGPDIRHLFF
jgi:hypothetical protein